MPLQNDSRRWLQIAPEGTYGAPVGWDLTVVATGGTFTLTVDGQTTTALAYNAIASVVVAAVAALTTVGVGNVSMSGTLSSTARLTFIGYRGLFVMSANFAAIVSPTTTSFGGGPAWLLIKCGKAGHTPKLGIEMAKELRNAPDMLYQDSVAAGGALENWTVDAKLRADQIGHWWRMAGFDDTVVLHSGETAVYDHTLKPGGGSSYSWRFYDGQTCYVSTGVVGTDLEVGGQAGESGKYDLTFKGWGTKARKVATVPTVALPNNTIYRMIKPTNTGVAVTLNGTTNYAYLNEFKLQWKREAGPYYTQTGTVDPYRAEYGERGADLSLTVLYDDTAPYDAALVVPPPAQAVAFTLPHMETVGTVPTTPTLGLSLPRYFYNGDPTIDTSGKATVIKMKAHTVFDTTTAGQVIVTLTNEIATAY